MKLDELPQQNVDDNELTRPREPRDAEVVPPNLEGELIFDTHEGNVSELQPGTEVCVYNVDPDPSDERPWLAIIKEVKGRKRLKVHWFRKNGSELKFTALFDRRGNPVTSVINSDTLMFWSMADKVTPSNMELSAYWTKKIAHEYSVLDEAFV